MPGPFRRRRGRRIAQGSTLQHVLDRQLELTENSNTYVPQAAGDERIVTDRYVLWLGTGDPAWNVAQRFRLRAEQIDEVRDEIRALVRARGRTLVQLGGRLFGDAR
jgi:hypothetical protein